VAVATITRTEGAASQPGIRFGPIDAALAPLYETLTTTDPHLVAQLKRGLAAMLSAEAMSSLIDLCGLTSDDAITSLVRTSTTATDAARHDHRGALVANGLRPR
jgi:hypothetical protein